MLDSSLDLAKKIIAANLRPGDTAIDATAGNGYDTLFLAELCGESGQVYAFDIQEHAIRTTEKLLSDRGCRKQVKLFHAGHERMDEYIPAGENISAVMFNLGYLPHSDKSLFTRAATTIAALRQALGMLVPGGVITVMVYGGHEGGREEGALVLDFAGTLDQGVYRSVSYQTLNRKNFPPLLIAIERLVD